MLITASVVNYILRINASLVNMIMIYVDALVAMATLMLVLN